MESILTGFDFPRTQPSIIKVIGVGGGGGNAVTHMYKEGIQDVNFVLCNTDNQALLNSGVPAVLQLGRTITEGLGAGGRPEVAKQAAEESIPDIKRMLEDGTKMVFVTAGMGGGTGTGAAPTIAKVAKDMGILTVGIVTIPFVFERKFKIIQALRGVREIRRNVDALLIINNEKLREVYADLTVLNAFKKADDNLTIAAKSIAEIITIPGYVNLDFNDVKTILKDGGVAIMSSGFASGAGRLAKAFDSALHSPLLNNNDVFKAKKILFNVYSGSQAPLMMDEMDEIDTFMDKFVTKDIEVIHGLAVDEALGEDVKVIILATGFDVENIPFMSEVTPEEEERQMEENAQDVKDIQDNYGGTKAIQILTDVRSPSQPFLFPSLECLDENSIIEALLSQPAYKRDLSQMRELVKKCLSL
ncbi:MAG: cell division protein FtsZ [Candidatus Symbiothrix sp.]|jgi:cell division protein FtsZ|nr:cell division protein FtsZ [Candidatus Symbiothrix sp.]